MATTDGESFGDIMSTNVYNSSAPLQTNVGRFVVWKYNPSSVNQGYSPFYKMRGYDTGVSGGWQTWENSSGDEAGRPAAVGVQTAGTVVAVWFVLFGA